MKVTLIAYTPSPEKLVAAAAKLCYSDSGCENIMDGLTEEKTKNFVNMLSDMAVSYTHLDVYKRQGLPKDFF